MGSGDLQMQLGSFLLFDTGRAASAKRGNTQQNNNWAQNEQSLDHVKRLALAAFQSTRSVFAQQNKSFKMVGLREHVEDSNVPDTV